MATKYPSPQNNSRGCLCKDNETYSVGCCDGSLEAQGIGSVTMGASDSSGTINNTNSERTITSTSS